MTEHDLIRTAQQALSRCNWVVGKCAADWTQRYARGRTDADFAQLVGLSADQVYQRRRVWETFGDVYADYTSLRWSHFYVGLNWDDAPECLQWADENGATVAEMRAWRRALRGEDLSEAADDSQLGDDPSIVRLSAMPADVRDPRDGEDQPRNGERREPSDDGDDIPFVSGSVSSANRETSASGDDYAPFRKDAGSAPPKSDGEDEPAGEKPSGQIAKRVISTLERIVSILTPQIVAAFRSLPERDRVRLVQAVKELGDRVAVLEPQEAA
ncbi:MAG: hypothetical protein H0T47_12905 [Planctomycetaceae bacterium]|nr:hypothetical protein [Planctomycetaceae bacterium]